MAVLLAFLPFVSTLLGGVFALRNRDQLHRILGFTAGVILGVVAFNVLPETADLAHKTGTDFKVPMVALVIGFLAFQVGHRLGISIALAVIAHDFADGLNTVSLMLTHGNTPRRSALMLLVDALMPLFGAATTLLFLLPDEGFLIYLGVFAGFLLYIGGSDILPEAHARHLSLATLARTVTGAGLTYVVVGVLP